MSENIENTGALDIPPEPAPSWNPTPPAAPPFNPIYRRPREYDGDGFVQHEDQE